MSKKHFIALADTLRKLNNNLFLRCTNIVMRDDEGYQTGQKGMIDIDICRREIRTELADFCQAQNPKFDRARWLGYIAGRQQ